jgi:phage terminase Nu1 subunit (DNA packaging protein)
MRTIARFVIIAVAVLGTAVAGASSNAVAKPARMTAAATSSTDLKSVMRKLWEDHITYTRNYIISALAEFPDTDAVAKRPLRNQDDIGDAIKPYYGAEAGKKLASLLREHIQIATDVVKAAKTGTKAELAAAQKKWSSNGRDIAAFLSEVNPRWSRREMEETLQKHLNLTTGEVVGRLKQDWAADIRSYDGHQHMLMLADTLSEGIAKQFPDKIAAGK